MLYKPINIYDSFWSQHIFGEIKKKISLRVTEELLLIQWWECYFWHAFKTALVCTHGINAVTERKYSIIYDFNTLLTNWKGSPHLTCPFLLQLIVFRFFFDIYTSPTVAVAAAPQDWTKQMWLTAQTEGQTDRFHKFSFTPSATSPDGTWTDLRLCVVRSEAWVSMFFCSSFVYRKQMHEWMDTAL